MKNTREMSIMHKWRAMGAALAFGLLAGLGLPGLALAQNTIQSITSTQQAGTEVVRVELSEALSAVPSGFSIQTPPRIAIDLPGVGSALGRGSVEINQGNLRSVNIAQAGERTRLVLNLKAPANYTAELQGKVLLLVLEASAPVATLPDQPVHFAPAQTTQTMGLKEIDFRRGNDGAGRVIVSLPSAQMGVDIRQQGQTLVVEFLRASLPDSLRRRLDVADFGTPVQSVTTFQSGDRVRMVIEPRGAWEHSAYQSDSQFVLEVRPTKIDPNKLTAGTGFQGEKLSLNFQNIEVRALLQVIADFTNFNIVTSDSVTGNVTLRLKDVPWDQALDIILQAKGLGVRRSGNVLLIAPKEELNAKEQIDLEARKRVAELEPLRTQSFQLNYARAEDIMKQITANQNLASGANVIGGNNAGSGASSRMLSPRGSVNFDMRTNQIFVTDIPSKLEEVMAVIQKIDIPVRQVLIEARIVEADDSFGRDLGVKLGYSDLRNSTTGLPRGGASAGGNYSAVGAQTGQGPGVAFSNTQFVNLPAVTDSTLGATAATFAVSLFNASVNRFLNLELSALEADGKGKIVSSPRVVTADQVEALIEQGTELPYQAATSSGATSVQFRKANLSLKVTPQITPEGNVILNVDVNKDSVGQPTVNGLAIDTKHVKTQVLVENGGTVVIGGIFTQTEQDQVYQVPVLGDIPVLGYLFKNKSRTSKRTELLVFITPKIVTDRSAAR